MSVSSVVPDRDLTRLRGLVARLDVPAPPARGVCAVPGCVHDPDAGERARAA